MESSDSRQQHLSQQYPPPLLGMLAIVDASRDVGFGYFSFRVEVHANIKSYYII